MRSKKAQLVLPTPKTLNKINREITGHSTP